MDEEPRDETKFWHGLLFGFLLHVCALVFFVFGNAGLAMLGGIGISQLLYAGPMMIYFYRSGKRNAFKGALVAAAITFLLNATCWGLVLTAR